MLRQAFSFSFQFPIAQSSNRRRCFQGASGPTGLIGAFQRSEWRRFVGYRVANRVFLVFPRIANGAVLFVSEEPIMPVCRFPRSQQCLHLSFLEEPIASIFFSRGPNRAVLSVNRVAFVFSRIEDGAILFVSEDPFVPFYWFPRGQACRRLSSSEEPIVRIGLLQRSQSRSLLISPESAMVPADMVPRYQLQRRQSCFFFLSVFRWPSLKLLPFFFQNS